MEIIGVIVAGIIIGLLGKFVAPSSRDNIPLWLTILCGIGGVLIGYDLRFWRELSALFGNPYLADFLHRLRVRSWVCAVQHLRRLTDLRGHLWSGHTELVDALWLRDTATARSMLEAYNAHALDLVERSTAG